MTYSSTQTSSSVWEFSWRWRYLLSLLAKLFNQKLVQDLLHCGGRIIMEHGPRSSCLPKLQAFDKDASSMPPLPGIFLSMSNYLSVFSSLFSQYHQPFPHYFPTFHWALHFQTSLLNYNFKGHVTRVTMKDRELKYIQFMKLILN